jgi:hypothetical protein
MANLVLHGSPGCLHHCFREQAEHIAGVGPAPMNAATIRDVYMLPLRGCAHSRDGITRLRSSEARGRMHDHSECTCRNGHDEGKHFHVAYEVRP